MGKPRVGHSSGVCMHVIMYTTQGHCVGVEATIYSMSDWLSPLVYVDADGRATTGPCTCAGVIQCFDDIGINHPPMNSGVISLNSLLAPATYVHFYILVINSFDLI